MSTTSIEFNKLVEQLSTLTIIQAVELSKLLEEKWGVSAAPVAVVSEAAPAAATIESAAEQTEFGVSLDSAGNKKIEVIKVVREITGLGLKEAKNLVESAPVVIKIGVNKTEAESIQEKLVAAGAKADIK